MEPASPQRSTEIHRDPLLRSESKSTTKRPQMTTANPYFRRVSLSNMPAGALLEKTLRPGALCRSPEAAIAERILSVASFKARPHFAMRRLLAACLSLSCAAGSRQLASKAEICDALLNPPTTSTTTTTTTELSTTELTTAPSTTEQTTTVTTYSTQTHSTSTATTYSTVTETTTSTSITATTITFTTTTKTTYEHGQLPILKDEFKQVIKEDGKLLVKDLMSWLMTRLVALFVGLTLATPLLMLIIHRCSKRCRSCTDRLKRMQFRGCTIFILLVTFLLAGGGSLILAYEVLDSVSVTIIDVRDYYLKEFVKNILQDILAETSKFNVELFTTQRQEQLNATLCNPTDDSFVMHSLTASAVVDGSELLRANLAHKVDIPPMSLGQLVVNYHILPNPGGIFGGTVSVVAGSWVSHRLGVEDVALISVLVNTDCKVRASRATVGMKINAPLLLSRLPDSFLVLNAKTRKEAISETFSEPDKVMYHLYNALLGGLEQYRFFEWDSLELGGPLMIRVYFIVFFASLMLVVSVAGLVLMLMTCCRCRRSRAPPVPLVESSQTFGSPGSGDLEPLDSVVGRSLAFIEIDIPTEELKPKPHMTRSVSSKSRIVQS
eukprot:s1005_g12.t1